MGSRSFCARAGKAEGCLELGLVCQRRDSSAYIWMDHCDRVPFKFAVSPGCIVACLAKALSAPCRPHSGSLERPCPLSSKSTHTLSPTLRAPRARISQHFQLIRTLNLSSFAIGSFLVGVPLSGCIRILGSPSPRCMVTPIILESRAKRLGTLIFESALVVVSQASTRSTEKRSNWSAHLWLWLSILILCMLNHEVCKNGGQMERTYHLAEVIVSTEDFSSKVPCSKPRAVCNGLTLLCGRFECRPRCRYSLRSART
jgi:hypothetical protein